MQVLMKTNLGWVDAQTIGVNQAECMEGMTPEVSDKAGQWLIDHHKASELPVIRAVPPAAAHQKPSPTGRGKQSDKSTPDKEN